MSVQMMHLERTYLHNRNIELQLFTLTNPGTINVNYTSPRSIDRSIEEEADHK